ncbi:MAG: XRE family transcriptional regulator [Candidatus Lindowbacteria bacterium]|nr:XRE family transcriptional regulator [Candidatus Lindowbacteria bacterium]
MVKKTKLGQELIEGLNEVMAHQRGEITLKETTLVDDPPEWTKDKIASLRLKKLRVSQSIFASLLAVTRSAVQAWEQGQKRPTGSARRLLQVIDKDPKGFLKLTNANLTASK